MLVVILGMQVVLSYTSFNYSRVRISKFNQVDEDESRRPIWGTKPILLQVADSDAEKHLAKDLLQYNNNTVLTRSIDVLQVEVWDHGIYLFTWKLHLNETFLLLKSRVLFVHVT